MRYSGLAGLALVLLATAAPAGARPLGENGRIAFGRQDPLLHDLVAYTINPDGTHEEQVLSVRLPGEFPVWSPDGSRIVTGGSPNNQAAVIANPDDHSYYELPRTNPDLENYCGVWSVDGARLACESFGKTDSSLNGIYTVRSSDGGGMKRLTSNPGGDDIPGDYSPDGKRLVFSRLAPFDLPLAEWLAKSGLFVVNANGTGVRKIRPCCSTAGSWSPQGNEIVFSMHASDDVHSSLWLVHSDGSDPHQINVQVSPGQFECGAPNSDPTAGGCFEPSWSPDGRKIVFVRGTGDVQSDIYTVNPDGTRLTRVTGGVAGESDQTPDWGTHPLVH
jgi:TolB protein